MGYELICQSWLGKHDDSLTSHSEAIAHLLRAAALHEWNSTFEMEMVITLCVPIVCLDPDYSQQIQLISREITYKHWFG